MKIRVQVVFEPDDDGHDHTPVVHEVAHFERGALHVDTLGLQLAEAKNLLQDVQELTNFFERRVSAYQVAVKGEVAFHDDF